MFGKKRNIIHFCDIEQNVKNCVERLNSYNFDGLDRGKIIHTTIREYFKNYDVINYWHSPLFDKKTFKFYFENEDIGKIGRIVHYKHLIEREKQIMTETTYEEGPCRITSDWNQEYIHMCEIVDEEYKIKYEVIAQMSSKLWSRKYSYLNVNNKFSLSGPVLVKPFREPNYSAFIDGKEEYLNCEITVFILK